MRRTLRVMAATAAALALSGTGALAHVTVNPRETAGGGYAKLAFRVPNERDNAGTTKLEIIFPVEHPFASVGVRPQPGWTYSVEKRKLDEPIDNHGTQLAEVVSKVTWSGGVIKPGEFNEFEISVGRLPTDVDSISFKALQTYENGETVRWIEEAEPGAAEPERPAPVLRLTKSSTEAASAPTTAPASESQGGQVAEPATGEAVSKSDVDTARTFGILGMAFGLIGLVAGLAARRRGNPAA